MRLLDKQSPTRRRRALFTGLLFVSLLASARPAPAQIVSKNARPVKSAAPAVSVRLDALRVNAQDGASLTAWDDLSGNNNSAFADDPAKPFTYHSADPLDGLPYMDGGEDRSLAVPLPATAAKTVFVVAMNFPQYPVARFPLLQFGADPQFRTDVVLYSDYNNNRYGAYPSNTGGGSGEFGYALEYSVIAWRQKGASVTLFADGDERANFTLSAQPAPTAMRLGPGSTRYRQIVVFPSALSDAQVRAQTKLLRALDALDYESEYVTSLASPALVMRRRGLDGNRPLVILDHAAGATERMWRDLPAFNALTKALLDAGYIVAASRQHADSWGNGDALADDQSLYEYVAARYPVDTGKVAIVGDSMGGIPAMLAFPLTTIPLKGAALYYPVGDVQFQHDYRRPGVNFGGAIDNAYGGSFAANGAGHNPAARPASDWAGKRFIWFGSTLDTVVPHAQNTLAMRAHIADVAAENSFVELYADHNGNVETTTAALLDFLNRCFQ